MVGYGGKDLQARKVLSLEWKSEGVMDDESGESMERMEEMPLIQLGEAELERLVRGWRRGAGSWFQRRGEAYWKEQSSAVYAVVVCLPVRPSRQYCIESTGRIELVFGVVRKFVYSSQK